MVSESGEGPKLTATGSEGLRGRIGRAGGTNGNDADHVEGPGVDKSVPSRVVDDMKRFGPLGAALRAIFLFDEDSEQVDTLTRDSISARNEALVVTAARSRLHLQDTAYEVLAARDMLFESSESLTASTKSAEEASAEVRKAHESLTRAVTARKNIDLSLDVVSRTRSLVRMYARAEDMTASRRMHTALRTLDRLDEEKSSAENGTVLTHLIPTSEPLRAEMLGHVRRALRSWLTTILPETSLVGGRALSFARRKMRTTQHAMVGKDEGSREQLVALSMMQPLPPEDQWIPAALDEERGIDIGSITSGRVLSTGLKLGGGVDSSTLGQGASGMAGSTGERGSDSAAMGSVADSEANPRVPMRLLLTCVQTCRELGRLDAFASDYQRERTKQLEEGIGAIENEFRKAGGSSDTTSATSIAQRYVRKHTRLASFVAGFFVIERAVQNYTSAQLLLDATRASMWKRASSHVNQAALESTEVDASGAQRIRATQMAFLGLSNLYDFASDG